MTRSEWNWRRTRPQQQDSCWQYAPAEMRDLFSFAHKWPKEVKGKITERRPD